MRFVCINVLYYFERLRIKTRISLVNRLGDMRSRSPLEDFRRFPNDWKEWKENFLLEQRLAI